MSQNASTTIAAGDMAGVITLVEGTLLLICNPSSEY